MDLIIRTDHLPKPGEVVIGSEVQKIAGGKGGNQAAAAARLDAQVLMIGRVGRDENGEQLIRSLQDDDVDTAFISREQNALTGLAMIAVDSRGRNTTVVSPGANWLLDPDDIKEALDPIRRSDLLLLQLDIPLETVEYCADFARRNGVQVILNPAPPRPLSHQLLSNVHYLVMTADEVNALTDIHIRGRETLHRAAAALHERGVYAVVIVLADGDVFFSTGEGQGIVPAIPVNPIDTTAAEDAFVGALAVAIGDGRPIREAVKFAVAASALSTKKRGGRPSLPYLSELEDFLAQNEALFGE